MVNALPWVLHYALQEHAHIEIQGFVIMGSGRLFYITTLTNPGNWKLPILSNTYQISLFRRFTISFQSTIVMALVTFAQYMYMMAEPFTI